MASRKEQKEAARRAREQAVAQLKADHARRSRLLMLGGVVAVVVAAIVVVIVISSSGGGTLKALTPSKLSTQAADGAGFSPKAAVADVKSLLDGIPQSGNTLGKPNAPVTITEFGDLVCSTCDAFALSSEPQLIQQEVRTGKVKLVFRADDTASATANQSEWQATQVAAASAGLQRKEWNYVLLVYDEQPITIGGQSAELVPYVSSSYLANRAEQLPGLNLKAWQANLGNSTLIKQVRTDLAAAQVEAPRGTPTIIVTGPSGQSQTYDSSGKLSAVPSIAQLKQLIAQVS